MRNLLFIFIIIFYSGCTKPENTQSTVSVPNQVLNAILETAMKPEQTAIIETDPVKVITMEEINAEKRKAFENMSIQDMIDLIIDKGYLIFVGIDDIKNRIPCLGYFAFRSLDTIQWYSDTSGPRHFSYLNIIDENNLMIEVFNYFGSAEEIRIDNYCSTNKYYIDITKDHLIDYYLGIIGEIETYVATEYFKANITEEQELERNGFFFNVLRDAAVYEDSEMQGTELGLIPAGDMVKIINIHYQNLSDRYPTAARVEIENTSGWVNLDNVDFVLDVPVH